MYKPVPPTIVKKIQRKNLLMFGVKRAARYILNKRWSLKYSALPQKPRKKGRGKTGQTMMSPSFYSPLLFIKETCLSYPNLILDQV